MNEYINEGEEVLEPTFELANNPMWSAKTGEFLGNYHDKPDKTVQHFSELSFLMWFEKSGLDNWDTESSEYGIIRYFCFEGKKHWIREHMIKEKYSYEDVERLAELREFKDNTGKLLSALFKKMKRGENDMHSRIS